MFFRVLLFILFPFLGIVFLSYGLRLPIDGLLLGILLLLPMVMGVFAHYRYIGRLRSRGAFAAARRHMVLWRLLLPWEAYIRLKIEIAIEEGNEKEARVLLEKAREQGMEPAFLSGLEADLERRLGSPKKARVILEEALEATPPSLLRAGLLAQQARLAALSFSDQDSLRKADLALAEAEEITSGPPYRYLLDAIRGEIALARKEYRRAISLLKENLEALVDTARVSEAGRKDLPAHRKISRRASELFAVLTYSQQDEHQYPFFAELYLSLARAHMGRNEYEEAKSCAEQALALCAQPYVVQPLQKLLKEIPSS
ncbi:MAG: hypothetical protein H6727_14770 [Myxococcales bacterium]|nr:hypothetical protein [Myxococcales bacterium]